MAEPTINWDTKVITVPQSYLTPLGGTFYELPMDTFRKSLKAIEASEEGIPFVDTHRHVTETTIGGFTYARLIEFINGFTVTLEDGQYGVNTSGANHNLADVLNRNQVSVLTQNSAGLVNSPEIQFSSFDNAVTYDAINGVAGTDYPTGTLRQPSGNLSDAIAIATSRGLSRIRIIGDATINSGLDYTGMIFEGESDTKSTITVDAAANVVNCEFESATVQGTFDGDVTMHHCTTLDCNMVEGEIHECKCRGTFTLSGSAQFSMIDCVDDLAGFGIPTVDCGGDGPTVIIRGYRGGLELKNKSGATDISIDGVIRLILNATFGGTGSLIVRGLGPPIVNNSSFANITEQLVNPEAIWGSTEAKVVRAWSGGGKMEVDFETQEIILYDPDNPAVELARASLATDGGEDVTTQTGVQTKRGALVLS